VSVTSRRIGFFLADAYFDDLTPKGLKLFDTAINLPRQPAVIQEQPSAGLRDLGNR
jgi:hypothetical protein